MIEFVLGAFVGIVASYIFYRLLIIWTLRQLADMDISIQAIQQVQKMLIPARVEEHDGIFYVYNTRDNSFLVQGSTIEELQNNLESRFKDANVVVTEGDETVLSRLKSNNIAQSS